MVVKKTEGGMDFGGKVWKCLLENCIFWSEKMSGFEELHVGSTKIPMTTPFPHPMNVEQCLVWSQRFLSEEQSDRTVKVY